MFTEPIRSCLSLWDTAVLMEPYLRVAPTWPRRFHAGRNGIHRVTIYPYRLSSGLQRVFFKSVLSHRITLGDYRSGLSPAELKPVKDQLACPYTHFHVKFLGDMMHEKLSVPEVLFISEFSWSLSQVVVYCIHLLRHEPSCSSVSFSLHEGAKTFLVESLYPPFHCFGVLTKYASRVITVHSFADEKYAMQPVIIP